MASMISWFERQYYSMEWDAVVARISGIDDHHQEHWIEIETGKGYRDRRGVAIESIMAAIEQGHDPGRVFQQ